MNTLGTMVFGAIVGLWYVFVSWTLWGWFAVPIGAPVISFAEGFGLYAIAVSVLLWSLMISKNDAETDTTWTLSVGFVKAFLALIVLGEGWIAHLFIGGV